MTDQTTGATVGVAQRPGTEPGCADGHDVQRHGGKVYAAVVDGAGHRAETVRYAALAPAVITHIGATLGGLAGLITAGQMAHAYDRPPHMPAVYARAEPGQPTSVHWIGDCRAYGWDGTALTQWSTDQTMGEWLRWNGGRTISIVPAEVAESQDNWSLLGLAQASAATCRQLQIPAEIPLVLLTSDGVHDQVDKETVEDLCRAHADDPQALADALVHAAITDEDGYRDDATAIVIRTERTD